MVLAIVRLWHFTRLIRVIRRRSAAANGSHADWALKNEMRRSPWYSVTGITLGYWAWESCASGNIRVDLLLIYPLLFIGYIYLLWHRIRWWAIAVSALLMIMNYGFFAKSYSWFHKYPG